MGLQTLKRRNDFLRVRGGARSAMPSLVVEAKPRQMSHAEPDPGDGARFGFTVSKKVGKAVVRNRVRRRLKSAVTELRSAAQAHFDYVVIARPSAAEQAYADLKSDLARALARVNGASPEDRARRGRRQPIETRE